MTYDKARPQTSKSSASSAYTQLATQQGVDVVNGLEKGEVDNPQSDANRELTKAEHVLCCIVFIIMGTAELYYWNSVLNILLNITTDIYPDFPKISDTLNAVNMGGNIVAAAYNIWTGATNQKVVVMCGFIMAAMHLITATTVHTVSGRAGVILLHIWGIITGASNGFFQSNSYGLAASLPRMYAGYVSAGNGICGVVTFCIWMLFSEALYKRTSDMTPQETTAQTKKALWWLMSIGAVMMAISSGAYMFLLTKPFCKARVAATQKALKEEAQNPDAPSYMELLRISWKMILTVFFCLFITLFLFPTPGPFKWGDTQTQANIVTGMFQVGDLIGRYLPTLVPFCLLGPKTVFWSNLARPLFVIFFFLCYKYQDHSLWGSFGLHIFLMLTLSITNGWYVTCGLVHAPQALTEKTRWRSRVSAMALVGLLCGIFVGLWFSKLVFIWA